MQGFTAASTGVQQWWEFVQGFTAAASAGGATGRHVRSIMCRRMGGVAQQRPAATAGLQQ